MAEIPHKVVIVESLAGRNFQTYYCHSLRQALALERGLNKSLNRGRFILKVVPTDPLEAVP